MTKDQLITKLELDTALLALGASESGILAGAAVTLSAAAFGIPALVGAVAFAGFTLVAAVSPDSVDPVLEEVEGFKDYFSLPAIMAMPLSPFVSPKKDPMLGARVAGYLWDTTDIPESLGGAVKRAIPAAAGAHSFAEDIDHLGAYWSGRSTSQARTTSSSPRAGGSGGSGKESAHEIGLRPFQGKEPGPVKPREVNTTKGSATSQNSDGTSDHTLDKITNQLNKDAGDTSQDDRGTYDKDQGNDRSFWNDTNPAGKPLGSNSAPSGGNDGSGHEHEIEFHQGGERLAGGGEGDDRGGGRVA